MALLNRRSHAHRRCQFNGTRMSEKGLGFVIGSGGWRDTDALLGGSGHHVCDFCPTCSQTDGIVSPQTPPPSTLQCAPPGPRPRPEAGAHGVFWLCMLGTL